jgi:phasin family protein
MSIYQAPEHIAAANKVAVDSLLNVANTALASAERFSALNIHALRGAIENSVGATKSLLSANSPQQVAALQAALVQPNIANAVSYSRSLFEIGTQTQEVLSKLVQAQIGEFQAQVSALVDEAAKRAPAGSAVVVAAVKSAIASANSAIDTLNKTAKQVADLTESNVNAATGSLQKTA